MRAVDSAQPTLPASAEATTVARRLRGRETVILETICAAAARNDTNRVLELAAELRKVAAEHEEELYRPELAER